MTLGLSDTASGTAAAPSSFSSPLSSSLLITSSSAVAAATSASPTPQDFSTTASPVFSLNTTTTTTTTTISAVTTTSTTATMGLSMSTVSTITADISSTTAPTASSTNSGGGSSLLMQKPGDCELLGSFALFVQLALGALAMMSLVWKRYRERPQRPVKIWFFDASKQVFGSVLVHSANVFMAMLTSGRFSVKLQPRTMYHMRSMLMRRDDDPEAYQPNPCSWYLLNLAVDTTLGIPILIALLRIYTGIVARTPLGKPRESIQSGNYGSPPNAWWWFKQSIIYFCGLFGMKVVVLIIFVLFPWIAHVGDWALSWTEGNEELQIIFVMMLFPLIMNAMQYYIIDSFIKKQDPNHHAHDSLGRHSLVPNSDDGDDRPSDDLSTENEEDVADLNLSKSRTGASGGIKTDNDEYDPAKDGDTSTIFGSSSDHSQNTSPL
ncbi:Vacuolar membrane protein YPL162C [Ceratocystis fimbriata CBS 114723]|uniref:Vacuolar membrane protein YPL162C n=1 Tax=Ceratocystis fimbriata CBS 114723 TaxID=1035309 RepID=A0A2C5XIZ3_9PEZI|nr:Vacuolar membrane protein YPL162C [Ceratocystis fimbriata CBS 114723]